MKKIVDFINNNEGLLLLLVGIMIVSGGIYNVLWDQSGVHVSSDGQGKYVEENCFIINRRNPEQMEKTLDSLLRIRDTVGDSEKWKATQPRGSINRDVLVIEDGASKRATYRKFNQIINKGG